MKTQIFLKDFLKNESKQLEELLQTSSNVFELIYHNSPPDLRIKLTNFNLKNLYSSLIEEKDLERISTFICLHPYSEDCLLLGLAGAIGIKSTNQVVLEQAKEYLKKALMLDSSYASYLELLSTVCSAKEMGEILSQLEENIYVLRYKYELLGSIDTAIKIWEIDPLWNTELLIKEYHSALKDGLNLALLTKFVFNRIEVLPFDNYDIWECCFAGLEKLQGENLKRILHSNSWWLEYLEQSRKSEQDYKITERYRKFVGASS